MLRVHSSLQRHLEKQMSDKRKQDNYDLFLAIMIYLIQLGTWLINQGFINWKRNIWWLIGKSSVYFMVRNGSKNLVFCPLFPNSVKLRKSLEIQRIVPSPEAVSEIILEDGSLEKALTQSHLKPISLISWHHWGWEWWSDKRWKRIFLDFILSELPAPITCPKCTKFSPHWSQHRNYWFSVRAVAK